MISVSSMRTRGMKSFRTKKLVFFKKINSNDVSIIAFNAHKNYTIDSYNYSGSSCGYGVTVMDATYHSWSFGDAIRGKALDLEEELFAIITEKDISKHVPNDMSEFLDFICSDNWNQHIYESIILETNIIMICLLILLKHLI